MFWLVVIGCCIRCQIFLFVINHLNDIRKIVFLKNRLNEIITETHCKFQKCIFFSILDDKLFGENHWCAWNVYFLWFYLYTFCGDSLQTGARNSWKILQRLSSCQKSSRKRINIPIASTSSLMKKELINKNWVSWLFLLPPSISVYTCRKRPRGPRSLNV